MSFSLISAPPTLNNMITTHAIQPINTIIEKILQNNQLNLYIFTILLYSL